MADKKTLPLAQIFEAPLSARNGKVDADWKPPKRNFELGPEDVREIFTAVDKALENFQQKHWPKRKVD